VKVSLVAVTGEKNTVHISEIKVSDAQAEQFNGAKISSKTLQASAQAASATSASIVENYPHAKAVGRFTNGTNSFGTGWIAPNGAIVTSFDIAYYYHIVAEKKYDIIEFNVPASEGTTVKHPSPQDQYKVIVATESIENYAIFFKDGEGYFNANGTILIPFPSDGLLPGERQQQFFRIAPNPGNFTINAKNKNNDPIQVDIFHYGSLVGDNLAGRYRTLHLHETSLYEQNQYLKSTSDGERDWYVLYDAGLLLGSDNTLYHTTSDDGGPITYAGSNFAIGIHNQSLKGNGYASHGLGFSNEAFRNKLKNVFSAKSVYVDYEPRSTTNTGNGNIHFPYQTVSQAVMAAPNGAQIYIAKGNYSSTFTINRPMTLRAPVGKVVIGSSAATARTAALPSIPRELYMD
ncbi:hypothetical protein Q0590_37325, partial [Rhodocytophaga aerolata]